MPMVFRMGGRGSWALVGLWLLGCGSSSGGGPATPADGGMGAGGGARGDGAQASLRMRSCNLVRPSAGDIDRAVASAIERVRARSGPAVFDAWGDPAMFSQVVTAVEDQLVCETGVGPATSTAAVADPCYTATGGQVPGNRYCGPFCNGDNPVTSEILNDSCFRHDKCYGAIEEHTGVPFPRECTFSALTTECDRPFYELCDLILSSASDTFPSNDRIACYLAKTYFGPAHAANCKDPCGVFGRWESSCPALTKCPAASSPAEVKPFEVSLAVAANGGALSSGHPFDVASCSLKLMVTNVAAAQTCGIPLDLSCKLAENGTCPRLAYSRNSGQCTCKDSVTCTFRHPGLPP